MFIGCLLISVQLILCELENQLNVVQLLQMY